MTHPLLQEDALAQIRRGLEHRPDLVALIEAAVVQNDRRVRAVSRLATRLADVLADRQAAQIGTSL
jgi:hypothetical protein